MAQVGMLELERALKLAPGAINRNRRAVGLPPILSVAEFAECDAHRATGGPHRSRGVYVGEYHGGALWACTHRSKQGRVCGSVQLSF